MSKCTIEFNGNISEFFEKIEEMKGIYLKKRTKIIAMLDINEIEYGIIGDYGVSVNVGEISETKSKYAAFWFSAIDEIMVETELKELGITITD
jgi:hypothetical protein